MKNINNTLDDVETLTKKTLGRTEESARELYEKGVNMLEEAKKNVQQIEDVMSVTGKKTIKNAAGYVSKHPWQSMGIAISEVYCQ